MQILETLDAVAVVEQLVVVVVAGSALEGRLVLRVVFEQQLLLEAVLVAIGLVVAFVGQHVVVIVLAELVAVLVV